MKLILTLIAFVITNVLANTEKIILEARSSVLNKHCDATVFQSSLIPPYTKLQQSISPSSTTTGNSTQLFQLAELDDGSNYEIRISYPAITPADFTMQAVDGCIASNGKLLYTLTVSAVYTGVSRNPEMETAPIVYDLVLETLYFGFIFYECYKIVLAIIGMLFLGQFVIIPKVKEIVMQKAKAL